MIELFIIADDFTGALDTGVQFAARGVPTRVITDPAADIARDWGDARVLVMDAETRHLPPLEAYDTVYRAARQAVEIGTPYLYKKTDSALRGNVGAELTALMRAAGCRALPFLPAFPKIGRTTENGVHYIEATPVAESVFGRDPFEPVTESEVSRLLALQSEEKTRVFPAGFDPAELDGQEGILVFDAETDADLARAGALLKERGLLRAAAGCAGFGAVEQELLGLSGGDAAGEPPLQPGFTVVCGSVNPITKKQLDAAERAGFLRLAMACREKLTPGYFAGAEGKETLKEWHEAFRANPCRIIDGNDAPGSESTIEWAAEHGISIDGIRVGISGAMGDIVSEIADWEEVGTLLITGGDTLLSCMARMGVSELTPVAELYPGVVLSRFERNRKTRLVISKSGGFGQESLFADLAEKCG